MYVCKEYLPSKKAILAGIEVSKKYRKNNGYKWTDGENPCPALLMSVIDGLISIEDCKKIIAYNKQGIPPEFCRTPSNVSFYLIDVMEWFDKIFVGESYPVTLNKNPGKVGEILEKVMENG